MAVDYAALRDSLATALQRYADGGGAEEWSEGSHRVRLSDPTKVLAMIQDLDRLAFDSAGGAIFRPILEADLP